MKKNKAIKNKAIMDELRVGMELPAHLTAFIREMAIREGGDAKKVDEYIEERISSVIDAYSKMTEEEFENEEKLIIQALAIAMADKILDEAPEPKWLS